MTQKANITDTTEFQNFVQLISVYTAAQHALDGLENDANQAQLELVDERLEEYTELQEKITKTEEVLQLIALKHPEWFGEKSSIKTPYGSVKFTPSTSLDFANEELSIELIERGLATSMIAKPSDYIRVTKTLNLEALAALSDEELAQFRITRVSKKHFNVTPAKLDMGKAVKARQQKQAEKPEAAAA